MKNKQLISRRRHYIYVLVFSNALWLFIAMAVGGFVPVMYMETGQCGCGIHQMQINASFIVYGIGSLIVGVIFSYPLHRLISVTHSQPTDKKLPLSRIVRLGKILSGWRGLLFIVFISCVFLIGSLLTHKYFVTHPLYKKGLTELHCAAGRGDLDTVLSELETGAKINQCIEFDYEKNSTLCRWSGTPLHFAALNGHLDIASMLISKGADVNVKNTYELTPLYYAVDHKNILVLLIKNGADVDVKTWNNLTPVYWAAQSGSNDSLLVLIENGANISAVCSTGRNTPLDIAEKCGHPETVKLLRAHGAKTRGEVWEETEK